MKSKFIQPAYIILSLLLLFAHCSQSFAAELASSYLDSNVKIVLSDDFEGIYRYQRTASIIPSFSFAAELARERNLAASDEFMTFSFSTSSEDSSFFSDMMLDVGRPLSAKYMETDEEFDDTILTQPSLYADISSAVLSYFFRKLTQGRLDLVLLTPPLEEPSDELISGVELGLRLNQHYGVRVKMLDNNTLPTYGMQLEFFPVQNVSIKLSHEIITNAPISNTGAASTTPDSPDADEPELPPVPDSSENLPTTSPDNATHGSSEPKTEQRTGVELNIKF